VPYALALGLLVAILDLIPLAGATLAGIIIVTVAFLTSTTAGVVVAVFFVLYQQLENHLLQPLVYGRTVELSPLGALTFYFDIAKAIWSAARLAASVIDARDLDHANELLRGLGVRSELDYERDALHTVRHPSN